MADSSFGLRDVALDINGVVTARVVRDATKGEQAKVTGLTLAGTTGAGAGTLILRFESASGPIFWRFETTNATQYNVTVSFGEGLGARIGKGLYVDAIGTAWAAGSLLIIHFA